MEAAGGARDVELRTGSQSTAVTGQTCAVVTYHFIGASTWPRSWIPIIWNILAQFQITSHFNRTATAHVWSSFGPRRWQTNRWIEQRQAWSHFHDGTYSKHPVARVRQIFQHDPVWPVSSNYDTEPHGLSKLKNGNMCLSESQERNSCSLLTLFNLNR